MTSGIIILGAVLFLFAGLSIFSRYREIKKTKSWIPMLATVTDVRSFLIGEASIPFVDVTFLYGDKQFFVKNVDTDGIEKSDYPKGSKIQLLIDPENPTRCLIAKPVIYDNLLKKTFKS